MSRKAVNSGESCWATATPADSANATAAANVIFRSKLRMNWLRGDRNGQVARTVYDAEAGSRSSGLDRGSRWRRRSTCRWGHLVQPLLLRLGTQVRDRDRG